MNRNFTEEGQTSQRRMKVSAVSSLIKEMQNKTTGK